MNAYWAHFKTSFREDMQFFFSDSLIGSVGTLALITIILLLYQATHAALFFGLYTWSMLVWYIITTELLIQSQTGVVSRLSKQIQSGEIVSFMSKPYHYPFALLTKHLGSAAVESIAILMLAIPLGILLAGTATLSAGGIFFGIIAILFALLLDFTLSMSIGLIAFWTEDAGPYRWIYSKTLFILGGLMFPLEIFPSWLQSIAKVLPPAFMLYYPARLVVNFSWDLLITVLIGQLAYLALFSLIAMWMYKRAFRRVSINGG